MPDNLSNQIDQARALEDYYRTKMLYWKYLRQQLENQLVLESEAVLSQAEEIAEKAWDNEDLRLPGNQNIF